MISVTVTACPDLEHVEAAVRELSRAEPRGACPPLQTLSYRAFRLQCLRALAKPAATEPAPFRASLGGRISLSYDRGTVAVVLRDAAPSLGAARPRRKRKHAAAGSDTSAESDGGE